MAKLSHREINEAFEPFFDSEDIALLAHVAGDDDDVPQGLHQGGYTRCKRHPDEAFPKNQKCWWCEQEAQDEAVMEFKYAEPMHDQFFEYNVWDAD